jgi:hypothetical protein
MGDRGRGVKGRQDIPQLALMPRVHAASGRPAQTAVSTPCGVCSLSFRTVTRHVAHVKIILACQIAAPDYWHAAFAPGLAKVDFAFQKVFPIREAMRSPCAGRFAVCRMFLETFRWRAASISKPDESCRSAAFRADRQGDSRRRRQQRRGVTFHTYCRRAAPSPL